MGKGELQNELDPPHVEELKLLVEIFFFDSGVDTISGGFCFELTFNFCDDFECCCLVVEDDLEMECTGAVFAGEGVTFPSGVVDLEGGTETECGPSNCMK